VARLANLVLVGHGGGPVARGLVPTTVGLPIVSAMRITLPSGTEAEIAEPADSDDESTMGLVIAPDIFGLRPLFDDMVARLSSVWSMTVCAVEPFPGLDLGSDVEPRMAAMSGLDDDVHLRDLQEAADATGCERVGLLGFCMGGMYCLKAARSDRFAKIVSFYGMIRLPEAWRGPGQGEPLEYLAAGHPDRVLAIIGDLDPYTPPDDVAALETTGAQVVRYVDAEHGFAHAPERPAHRPADAADAFRRAHVWLTS
jgi:carboxymethylenebutenolidase